MPVRMIGRLAAKLKQNPGDADGWRQSFAWPQKGRISGMFGNQRIYQGKPGRVGSHGRGGKRRVGTAGAGLLLVFEQS